MNADGYPDDTDLYTVQSWLIQDGWKELFAYIRERWHFADWGWTEKRGGRYLISTGGWSGNEDMISAMRGNERFWHDCWYSLKRGGHYEFRLPLPDRLVECVH